MQKGVKFRIYPNREQQTIINQTLGCCRLIYNKGLAMRNEAYQNGNKIGYSQTSAMLTDLKKSDDFAFLKAVDSIALQQSSVNGSVRSAIQSMIGIPTQVSTYWIRDCKCSQHSKHKTIEHMNCTVGHTGTV